MSSAKVYKSNLSEVGKLMVDPVESATQKKKIRSFLEPIQIKRNQQMQDSKQPEKAQVKSCEKVFIRGKTVLAAPYKLKQIKQEGIKNPDQMKNIIKSKSFLLNQNNENSQLDNLKTEPSKFEQQALERYNNLSKYYQTVNLQQEQSLQDKDIDINIKTPQKNHKRTKSYSIQQTSYCSQIYTSAGAKNKPLYQYSANAQRNRLLLPDPKKPFTTKSNIVFGNPLHARANMPIT